MHLCACSVVSNSLRPPSTIALQLLCPWDYPGKNTGVVCHFLLQGIFLTQGSNLHLLHWQVILYHWATWEAQNVFIFSFIDFLFKLNIIPRSEMYHSWVNYDHFCSLFFGQYFTNLILYNHDLNRKYYLFNTV